MIWDDARIGRAIAILSRTSDISDALASMSYEFGSDVTYYSVRNMLRRHDLGNPSDYLNLATPTKQLVDLMQPLRTAMTPDEVAAYFAGSAKIEADHDAERGIARHAGKRIMVWPDVHAPYHDRRAWDLVLKVAHDYQPDYIIIMGDFADFYAVSSHAKTPSRLNNHKDEVDAVNGLLDQLDEIGASHKYYICGNHEDRYDRYVAEKAPELYGLQDIPTQFQLKERGWNWVPYRDYVKIGKVHFTHDTGSAGGKAHSQAVGDFEGSAVIGHVHRINVTYSGNVMGASHVGASFGWLGDAAEISYMHRAKTARDWHLGFGTGVMLDDGVVFLQAHPIIGYQTIVDGVLYK